jgi:hypothetical protein
MKLALIRSGTRGDVQPMLCLAWGLQQRGHEVRLLVPQNTQAWIGMRRRAVHSAAGLDQVCIPELCCSWLRSVHPCSQTSSASCGPSPAIAGHQSSHTFDEFA